MAGVRFWRDIPEVNLDEDPDNADWTKQEWDLPFPPDPSDERFRKWLAAQGLTFEEFQRLPAWRHYQRRQREGRRP